MKKIISIVAGLVLAMNIIAQGYSDAFKYTQNIYLGSGRASAMGNAFGALGGDFSGLTINPAGLGVYRASEMSFSTAFTSSSTKSNYFNTQSEDMGYNMKINNASYVYTYNSGLSEGWVSTSFAIGYNRLNNSNSNLIIRGKDIENFNMGVTFLDKYLNPNPNSNDFYYNEDLAWRSFLVDSVGGQYVTNVPYKVNKTLTKSTTSSSGEWLLALAGNFSNKLYLGVSLGIQTYNYHSTVNYSEDFQPNYGFTHYQYNREYNISATGFNFKLGGIYKPLDFLRLGLSVHLPTFYSFNDRFDANISTNLTGANDPIYPEENGQLLGALENDYKFSTPFKAIGSIAFTINKIAIFSFDCDAIDYTKMKFSNGNQGYAFTDQNQEIRSLMRQTFNFRAGGEVKLGSVYLRTGGGLYQSPFKANTIDGQTYGITGGIGYRNSNFFVDFSFVHYQAQEKYDMQDEGLDNNNNFIRNPTLSTNLYYFDRGTLTLGFRF